MVQVDFKGQVAEVDFKGQMAKVDRTKQVVEVDPGRQELFLSLLPPYSFISFLLKIQA